MRKKNSINPKKTEKNFSSQRKIIEDDPRKNPDGTWAKDKFWEGYNPAFGHKFIRSGISSKIEEIKNCGCGGSSKKSSKKKKSRKKSDSNDYFSKYQNVVVKFRYGNGVENHEKFTKEYLRQKNKKQVKNKPILFSNKEIEVDENYIEKYTKRASSRFYKFIISPENQNLKDMKTFTRTFVKKMEAYFGRKFDWIASQHNDTAHTHIHLLINGIDKNGFPIDKFPKDFIKFGARKIARNVATEILGFRTKREIEESKSKSFTSPRYVPHLDSKIEILQKLQGDTNIIKTTDPSLIKRLTFLSSDKVNLASPVKNAKGTFQLEKDWKEILLTIGRYKEFNLMRKILKDFNSKNQNAPKLTLYKSELGEIKGKVIRIFNKSDNEEYWSNSIIVLNKEKNVTYYVPLFFEAFRDLLGKEISVDVIKNQSGLLVPRIHNLSEKNGIGKWKKFVIR